MFQIEKIESTIIPDVLVRIDQQYVASGLKALFITGIITF